MEAMKINFSRNVREDKNPDSQRTRMSPEESYHVKYRKRRWGGHIKEKAEGAHFFHERSLVIKSHLEDTNCCKGAACVRDERGMHQEGSQGWAPNPVPK